MHRAALLVLTAAVTFVNSNRVEGKARFMDLPATVAAADAVAIVQVDSGEKVPGTKKGYWTYGQKSSFRFIEIIKRAPFVAASNTDPQILWAEKDFICASESVRPGRYLLFLESVDPSEWIPVNHDRGVLPIEGETVPWPYAGTVNTKRTLAQAKASIVQAKALSGTVRFTAEIVGSFAGLYNRWVPSRSHQVLVFHLHGKAPSPWPAEHLFARAVVPKEVADRDEYDAWVNGDGKLSVRAEWIDGALVIREARKVVPVRRLSAKPPGQRP
jgi:hypothetical protein